MQRHAAVWALCLPRGPHSCIATGFWRKSGRGVSGRDNAFCPHILPITDDGPLSSVGMPGPRLVMRHYGPCLLVLLFLGHHGTAARLPNAIEIPPLFDALSIHHAYAALSERPH